MFTLCIRYSPQNKTIHIQWEDAVYYIHYVCTRYIHYDPEIMLLAI